MKYISIKEFRDLGFLQEINRLLLHKCGLALSITEHTDGTCSLGPIWDYRDDPEGILYGKINYDKVETVKQYQIYKSDERFKTGACNVEGTQLRDYNENRTEYEAQS